MNQQTTADFSDGTIRRFLLAQLSRGEQSAFERALLMNPQLEQRARLAEIALIDDCVLNRLKANERDVFQKEFLVTTARRRKLEVSNALRQTLAVENVSRPARSLSVQSVFVWPTLAWRIAFAIAVLTVLFASALVIRREPQIVKRIIPKRLRPATVPAANSGSGASSAIQPNRRSTVKRHLSCRHTKLRRRRWSCSQTHRPTTRLSSVLQITRPKLCDLN